MKRRIRTQLRISASSAAHALHVLIADGKLAAKDVVNALKRREAMIDELRQRLVALEQGLVSSTAVVRKAATRRAKVKPRRRVSAARRAAMRLHGTYLGTIRPLSKANRAKVKAIREKSGVRAAIAVAKRIAP